MHAIKNQMFLNKLLKGIRAPKHECTVCGSSVRLFLPYGMNPLVKPRPNAQCQVCGSLERHRLIWLYFREKTNLFEEKLKMLHVAPEGQIGKLLKALPNVEYISADLMPGKAMVQMDITDIKYPDNSFDVIYASHVLEHIPDDKKAMRELCRVLKPSGWAILIVPMWGEKTIEDPQVSTPEERQRVYGQDDHVRRYGLDGVYRKRLEESGFTVNVDSFVKKLGPDKAAFYGLKGSEDIYFCTKTAQTDGKTPEKEIVKTASAGPLRADFERFIEERASTYGFTEQTRFGWIKYMTRDFERGTALVKELLLHFALPEERRQRALDVGCGFGGLAYALSQEFESASGIELVDERVDWAQRRFPGIEIVKGNATRLPWPDRHFDFMVCNDVFEHVSYEDQKKAAAELYRVLKPGGVGYIAVPNRFQLRDDHNGVWLSTYFPHPLRKYAVKAMGGNRYLRCFELTRAGWKKLFERNGFRVTMIPAAFYKNNRFFPPQHWKIYLRKL